LNVARKVKAAENRTDPALLLACIYASLGEGDEVFRWLQTALENKSVPLYIFRLDPSFRRYKADPRYNGFLRSMGLAHTAKAEGPDI
jgi:hypothetical protein